MNLWFRLKNMLVVWGKLTRVSFQVLYGTWKVTKLNPPIVSIFGGASLSKDDYYFKQAHQLAQQLVETGISVLTGGGPGAMEAANCGAFLSKKSRGKSIGIGVKGIEESKNPCLHQYFELNYFFARKWLLTSYSQAFIVFPGGFGTLDELSEVLTLMQTKRTKQVPIVLVGVEYWTPLMRWITQEALEHGLVREAHIKLFTITDDLEEVFCIVRDECPLHPLTPPATPM